MTDVLLIVLNTLAALILVGIIRLCQILDRNDQDTPRRAADDDVDPRRRAHTNQTGPDHAA